MDSFVKVLSSYSESPISILDSGIPLNGYRPLDLSNTNTELISIDITDPLICQAYIDTVLQRLDGQIACGGYLEERNLYANKANFSANRSAQRNIHLGIDYWCKAGTQVVVPLNGTVHSFKNNNTIGDYGPTIILEHTLGVHVFYTLYGHLSLDSLEALYIGKEFITGTVLGKLGTPDMNVNYAPHLHFQIILDIETYLGDYPGVCAATQVDFYKKNCPNPNLLLKLGP